MFMHRRLVSALLSMIVVIVLFLPGVGVASVEAKSYCNPIVPFDRTNFPASPMIDNRYFPFVPGTQFVYEGTSNQGGGPTAHTVIFTVTSLTQMIDGVNTVMVWDRDFDGSQLAEAELSFWAQDNDGNVWNLAEYPEEYDVNGNFTGAPSTWVSGLDGAQGGIHMLAKPKTGTGQYLEGYSASIDFLDCAKVFKKNQTVFGPLGSFDKALVISETSPLDQGGGKQYKYYAPGIGIVQIGAVGDPQAETLSLTQLNQLQGNALQEVNQAAQALSQHGCQTNDLYSQTCS